MFKTGFFRIFLKFIFLMDLRKTKTMSKARKIQVKFGSKTRIFKWKKPKREVFQD